VSGVQVLGAALKDDVQLIAETLQGDPAPFGELVSRYQNRLYNTLVHLVGSTDLAYDAVQDAFVQALVKLETFERSSQFYTWLYRIAFNQAMSRRRREKPLSSVEQIREASGREPVDRSGPPESRLEDEELAAQVQAALAKVSDEHRAILILREVDDCSYEQIAEILDLPIGTIRSRLHRARLELRDELRGVFQEDVT
jgi:RNA polymerase sigma-70 factor (ECF subfamily)